MVERQPLLVSFNGIHFDFPLLAALLRLQQGPAIETLAQEFLVLVQTSYDLLFAIWAADRSRAHERGLNGLDAVSQANGYGAKAMDGAMAPRLWAQGHIAAVLNYCAADVWKTKALFEQILTRGGLYRGDGSWLALEPPALARWQERLATPDEDVSHA